VQLRRPDYIFCVIALLVALGIAWSFLDTPKAVGVGVLGLIDYCKSLVANNETVPTSCEVWIPGQKKRVWVYMPTAAPGHEVRLIMMRGAITGRHYYAVDYASKP
jgi:hypothetical protein